MNPVVESVLVDSSAKDLSNNPQVCEQETILGSESLDNNLEQQINSRQYVYIPQDWVMPKLDQIKSNSTLGIVTSVAPESVVVSQNILSMSILTNTGETATMEIHFFEDGIFKLNCINPVNPSKFSFELVEKPSNLTPYSISDKVVIEKDLVVVSLTQVQAKVVITLNPFTITLQNENNETLFKVNSNNSLKFDENLTCDFTFSTEYLYGLPERATDLLLEDTQKDLPYRFYNQDVPVYPLGCKNSLYGTVPIIVGRNPNSKTLVSMYWQNTSDTYIDIHRTGPTTNAYWLSERGNLECYIFVSQSNISHYKATSNVFGHCAMPQYFSLGYHQCRWSYLDQKDVLHVNEKFNEHEIPCDTITLDIDHTNGCRYFTFNKKLYPDPVAMQEVLVQNGRQLVTIADPHIKVDEDYHVYSDAIKQELYVKDKDNKPFVGKCWPGESIYLDFLNEEARQHWASQYSYEKYLYSTPNLWAWNDMNEPSVFEMPGNHMPIDNLQTFKSLSEPEKAFQVEHREVHNIYGYCHHKATYGGMIKRNESQNIRPHVLSRSFYAGSQKFTAIWTGDTGASWEYLKNTVPQLLSLALCGISNAGGDIGGFMGNPEPELAVRWYQLGTFMPYFRGHSETTTKRREPWLYEKRYADIIKEAIKERYRLLPYWYTAFEEHCRTAVPLLRPIWFDQESISEQDNMKEQERFFIGEGLLVVPVLDRGQLSIQGSLKGLEGRWYDYFAKREVLGDEEIKIGLERIGCFVKGGHIIPTFDVKSYVKSSKDARESNIHLLIAVNEDDNASGKLYFDDGETFNYKKGSFTRKTVDFCKDTLTWKGEHSEYQVDNRVTKITIMGMENNFENAYLIEENKVKQKIQLIKESGHLIVELVTLVSRNFKIVLE